MILFRLRKSAKLGFVLSVLGLAYISLFTMDPSSQPSDSKDFIRRSFEKLLELLKFGGSRLEDRQNFQNYLHELTNQKLKDDYTRSSTSLRQDDLIFTRVSAPDYVHQSDEGFHKKPILQPFDPRFTLAVYLEWIREHPEEPILFHWSDWVDLSPLHRHILAPKTEKESCKSLFHLDDKQKRRSTTVPVDEYCTDDENFPLGFKVTGFPAAQTETNAKILAKSFLYSSFPNPSNLIFLTNAKGAYHIEIKSVENKLENSLLQNKIPESVFGSRISKQLDVLEAYQSLLSARDSDVGLQEEPTQIAMDRAWFTVDVNTTIYDLEHMERSKQENNYLSSLKTSVSVRAPEKSFRETKILTSNKRSSLGNHYDWRFFDGFIADTEVQTHSLKKLLKTYLHFCHSHGLVTWIAHGTLLSWYWNGMIFPWDNDIDVQMPLRDLHRLARGFNQSLVVENVGLDTLGSTDIEFNGMGTFFIDVGTSITHRESENGLNNIDARFIDTNTGLYVDITGLALSSERAPMRYKNLFGATSSPRDDKAINEAAGLFNCRNKHFTSLEELSPLVKAVIQDGVGYVPQKLHPILQQEYSSAGLSGHTFNGHHYVDSLRLWIKTKLLHEYISDPKSWVESRQGVFTGEPRTRIKDFSQLTEDDFKNLLLDEHILSEFLNNRNVTRFHEKQINYLFRNRKSRYFSNLGEYLSEKQTQRPVWNDLFMRKVAIQEWDYEEEVKKLNGIMPI